MRNNHNGKEIKVRKARPKRTIHYVIIEVVVSVGSQPDKGGMRFP